MAQAFSSTAPNCAPPSQPMAAHGAQCRAEAWKLHAAPEQCIPASKCRVTRGKNGTSLDSVHSESATICWGEEIKLASWLLAASHWTVNMLRIPASHWTVNMLRIPARWLQRLQHCSWSCAVPIQGLEAQNLKHTDFTEIFQNPVRKDEKFKWNNSSFLRYFCFPFALHSVLGYHILYKHVSNHIAFHSTFLKEMFFLEDLKPSHFFPLQISFFCWLHRLPNLSSFLYLAVI